MLSAPVSPARRAASRPLTPLSRGDRIIIALLVLLPLALYGIPAIFGHLFAPGDDLNQNLPLRILAGEFIRSGHLPLWNPSIWSGTPLLGGWNAGALFPGTLLFAFLPVTPAWIINLAAAPAIGAIGIYLLLRRFVLAELAACFGALLFAYTGFMSGQIVHIGLDQGTAFTPWILLALDRFLRPTDRGDDEHLWSRLTSRTTLGWILLLGVAIACTALAGDPRAISNGAIIAAIYLAVLLTRPGARLRSGSLPVLCGLVLGALLAAAQLLPGIAFLHASQRGSVGLSFFGTGSLPIGEILSYLLVPFTLGGNGSLGLLTFEGNYNLPEVTIGAGLIALMAVGAYLPTLGRSLWSWVWRRQRVARALEARRQLGVWYGLIVIGVLLTLGTASPLGRLLVQIPFFGTERLQNRNALLIDIALAVLAAFFADDLLHAICTRTLGELSIRTRAARFFALLPVLFTLVYIAIELISPARIERFLNAATTNPALGTQLLGYLVPAALIAIALGLFWLFCHRLGSEHARRAFMVLALCDVGMFVVNASYASAPSSLYSAPTTQSSELKHLLGDQGRFALYDPYYKVTYSQASFVHEVGLPDINALQGNPSIQGYGSLVNGVYQSVTGSHLLNNLNPKILASESVNTLDLRIFLTPAGYLENRLAPRQSVPVPSALDHLAPGIPWLNTGPWRLSHGAHTEWQLPAPTRLDRAELLLAAPPAPDQPLTVTLLDGATVVGHATTLARTNNTDLVRLNPTRPVTTIELADRSDTPVTVDAITILTAVTHQRYVLNGLLQGALSSPHWVYAQTIGLLTAYRNTEIHGYAWLQPATTHTPNTKVATSGKVVVTRAAVTDDQLMRVDTATGAILVRSEAYAQGWSVRISPLTGGETFTEPVHRFGLIQSVDLPPGSWRVSWHYRPSSVIEGLVLSALGLLIALALALALLFGWYRRRRTRPVM